MQAIYIFGHKRPDTDSVCSSIALSYLKNKLGENTIPKVLGTINNETKYALEYFNVKEPEFLNDVKVQMRNMKYNKNAMINEKVSVACAFDAMHDLGVTGLPLINDLNQLTGYANLKEISRYLIEGDIDHLNTSYNNIIDTIEGKEVLRFDDLIEGKILAAAYKSETFVDRVKLNQDEILIVADRYNIMKYAIESKVKLMIIVGGNNVPEDLLQLATQNKVNIIKTNYTTYKTANRIKLSNYVSIININKNPIKFYLYDYRNEFIEISNRYGHTNYPIVNKKNECLGMIKLLDMNNYEKKKVILVDHNQKDQTVDGIDEADIIGVIDHHNLGTIGTNIPINFRVMPVGCTSTILYIMFKENHVEIPTNIAGIMASAIISDTLLLKSPTTTNMDIEICNELCEIANIDMNKYGSEMLKRGSSIQGMDVGQVFNRDFKTYKTDNGVFGISQVVTMDFEEINNDKDKYIALLDQLQNVNDHIVDVLFVTDIIKNGSYVFYNNSGKKLLEDSFDIDDLLQGTFLRGFVSRKKQMLPPILETIERKN